MSHDSSSSSETLVAPLEPVNVEVAADSMRDGGFAARYSLGTLIGRGGMGEVRTCRDQRIGREVALKSIRADAASDVLEQRFLREARVQAQLEHPGIVPVYDLGLAPDGELYFTMKRIRGVSLETIVQGVRHGDPNLTDRFGLRRLLVAFNQACLTIDYAHRHGVLHRDLKPANIMIGDFGEVYVLDWGLAKVLSGGPDAGPMSHATAKGAVMGTPGYMAPEQVMPLGELDARADVYALGAVLFELLALEPLIVAQTDEIQDLFRATMRGADARASVRAPSRGIPPELDAICGRATALDPTQRFQSARDLSEAIERFLDGDRDVELRQRLAREHVERARQVLTLPSLDISARSQALSDLGRAMALDPEDPSALQAFVRVAETPMPVLPPEVETELTQRENEVLRFARRSGTFAYATYVLALPLLMWMGVRSWGLVVTMILFALLAMAGSLVARAGKLYTPLFYFVLLTSTVAIGITSRMFGAFVLSPGIAAVNVLGLCLIRPRRGAPWPLITSLGAGAIVIPALLESMGWAAPSYAFHEGTMQVLPNLVDLGQVPTLIVLLLMSLTLVAFPAALFGQTRSALDAAELDLRVRAWHLRRLAPGRRAG